MARYIECVTEQKSVSRTFFDAVWVAVLETAGELLPEFRRQFEALNKKHVSTDDEVKAWLTFFFKLKDYRPPPLEDVVARYFGPGGIDTKGLARLWNTSPFRASVRVRKADKALLLSVTEEILRAVQHSHQSSHKIVLRKT